jgi:hypothetical protein
MEKKVHGVYSISVKKGLVLVSLVFLFPCLPAGGLDIPGHDIGDSLNGIYGEEKNAYRGAFSLFNIPVGGRAESLASAFTAVADDASFLESNPAGSARMDRTELAFFHNNWFTEILTGTLVESLVVTHRIGNLGMGAGGKWLSAPAAEYRYFDTPLPGSYYSELAAILNGAYNFSLGSRFSGISLGANIKGAFRLVPDDEYSSSAVMADLGILSSFNLFKFYRSPDWNASLGLAVRNLGPLGRDPLPSLGALGLAYKPLESLLLSFDFFLPFDMGDIKHLGEPYFAAGLEFAHGAFPSLRGGFQLRSDSLRLALGSSLHLFGDGRSPGPAGKTARDGTFRSLDLDVDYGRELRFRDRPQNRLGLGIRLGLGKRTGGAGGPVEDLYAGGLEAYARGDYQEARRRWEEALELDSRFLPAREALSMLEETQAAGERVDAFLRMEP